MGISRTAGEVSVALSDTTTVAALTRQLTAAKAANATSVTITVPWSVVQPTKTTWNWTNLDNAVYHSRHVHQRKVRLVLSGPTPPWQSGVEPAPFAAFAAAVARRYNAVDPTFLAKYGLAPGANRFKLFTWSGTSVPNNLMFQAMVGTNVDKAIWQWVPVDYPHWLPIYSSVDVGVANGIAAINAWPGKFAFSGYSQGAIVASNILWELRYGSLQHRYQDLIGGVMFGNPCREANVTFPGGINPGGSGMAPDSGQPNGRVRNTPSWWWEFANSPAIPGVLGTDNFAVNPLTSAGADITAIYQVMLGEFTGASYDIFERARQVLNSETRVNAIRDAILSIKTIIEGSFAGHAQYGWSKPLPGSNLTSVQLGIRHLNNVGTAELAKYPTPRTFVDSIAVWDAPNTAASWGDAPNPYDYVAVLKAAYTAIKSASPSTVVEFGGLDAVVPRASRLSTTRQARLSRLQTLVAPTTFSEIRPVDFLAAAYLAGAKNFFDAVVHNPLSRATAQTAKPPAPSGDSIKQSDDLRSLMVAKGDAGKSIRWNVGYDTDTGKFTPLQQALYLDTLRWFAEARKDHVSGITVHTIADQA